jgi:hypothetical protein
MRKPADGMTRSVASAYAGAATRRDAPATLPLIGESPRDLLDPCDPGTAAALLRAKRKKRAGSLSAQIGEWEGEGGSIHPIAAIAQAVAPAVAHANMKHPDGTPT